MFVQAKELGLNAGTTIRDVAKFIQSGGGGQPFLATAGGKNAAGMEAALLRLNTSSHQSSTSNAQKQ